MPHEPIPRRIAPLDCIPCGTPSPWGISPGFPGLSPCAGHVAHALRTLPPVAAIALLRRAAPRLACVRPAASVHPEPGSNSSLYISYFSKLNPRTLIPFKEINALEFVFGTLLVLLLPVLSMNFRFHPETLSRLISSRPGASQVPLFPNGIAKVLLFPEPPNFSALFFIFFVQTDSQMTTIIPHHIVKYLDVSAIYTEAKKSPHHERISSCRKNLPIMKGLSDLSIDA